MKKGLFVIAAFLFSGAVSAQEVSTTATHSVTAQNKSVNTATSGQTTAKAGKSNVNTASSSTASADFSKESNATVTSEGKSVISAEKATGELKNSVNNQADIAVEGTQHAVNVTNETAVETRSSLKSAVKTTGKVVSSHSVNAVTGIKTLPVKPSVRVGTNVGVGLK